MNNRQVNHARNVFDRAVTILPRANQLWYKYTYMEEMLGNIAGKLIAPSDELYLSYHKYNSEVLCFYRCSSSI